jgi:hypothetical protein
MERLFSLAILLVLLLGAAHGARAGAWGQEQGKGLIISNVSYYSANTYWDKKGKVRDSGGVFIKREFNPYVEYGLIEGWTLTFNGFYDYLSQTTANGGPKYSAQGVQDLEFGVQRQIYKNGGFVAAVKGSVIAPTGYGLYTLPTFGYSRTGAQADLMAGYGWQAFNRNMFLDWDVGYRAYKGYPSNQVRSLFTFGTDLTKVFQLLFQADLQYGVDNGNDVRLDKMSLASYYRLLKQVSQLRVRLNDSNSFTVGMALHLWGRNTGMGGGPVASYWYSF